MMDSYFKLIGFVLTFLGFAVFLRQKNGALAIGLTISMMLLCLSFVLPQIAAIWRAIEEMAADCDLDMMLFLPLLKVVGISICTKLTAEICRDAGEKALGAKVELAGTTTALLCALPLAQQVLKLITEVIT